eukprot:TRINITY_DN6975_c0_g1_i1.p1 TRINITY_DN6975_c0_g1~~TRINITY_DN6975_c0_g1_i1.p1  ORF type:complete len:111 (-),score=14.61 TRINITY_DN6975_c0_g1_i1:72-404(-)
MRDIQGCICLLHPLTQWGSMTFVAASSCSNRRVSRFSSSKSFNWPCMESLKRSSLSKAVFNLSNCSFRAWRSSSSISSSSVSSSIKSSSLGWAGGGWPVVSSSQFGMTDC